MARGSDDDDDDDDGTRAVRCATDDDGGRKQTPRLASGVVRTMDVAVFATSQLGASSSPSSRALRVVIARIAFSAFVSRAS